MAELAAGVAHDFNNILQSIVGSLELILDDVPKDTPTWGYTNVALKAALRGSSLTHHLLSYAHKQILRPQVVELATFLPGIRDLLVRTLGPNITIILSVDGNPTILADPNQLETALLNLAINASQAMPHGGSLNLEAREERSAGLLQTLLTVSDTGTGMDETTLARCTDPFFTTKGVTGSGLGLSMVQGFTEQSGGCLRITSVLGQGTTVRLHMPSAAPESRYVMSTHPAVPQSSGRILLTDDSTDVLLTMSAFLLKAGYSVVQADSGNQALAIILATSTPFDALITDFAMPGMNGADLIRKGRIIQPGMRALLITGLDVSERLPLGTKLLYKPVQRKELVEALQQLMSDQPRVPEDAAI